MPDRWRHILGGLHVEVAILVFCGLILSETGKTRGPVFDAIGPDVLPTIVAVIVSGLTLLQIVLQIARGPQAQDVDDAPIHLPELLRGLVFAAVTIAYVALLASRMVPFWAATAVFAMVATLIMSRPPNLANAALGGGIGVVLGVVLQLVFTMILVIDLPT
jgi:hypothetical protein